MLGVQLRCTNTNKYFIWKDVSKVPMQVIVQASRTNTFVSGGNQGGKQQEFLLFCVVEVDLEKDCKFEFKYISLILLQNPQ